MDITNLSSVTTFNAGKSIDRKSSILGNSYVDKLSSLWGWKRGDKRNAQNDFEKKYGLNMVTVDSQGSGTVNDFKSMLNQAPLSDKLDKLFSAWLQDSTSGYDELRQRQQRIDELQFTYYNDPFISRVVQLVADEATQLDSQDRLITVEAADPRLAERLYVLFDKWGITQSRIHGACFNLELLGEHFWANKISEKGVEKIIPLKANQIQERLEFNPTKVSEELRQRRGGVISMANHDTKVQMLLQAFDNEANMNDFADIFETKLFGYVIDDETVVPPWSITHMRLNADSSEFYPYGKPHLLAALAPFKQAASTMTLQSLARIMSFPVTLYKVKTTPGMDEALVWEHIQRVKGEYDQVGVSPVSGQSEAYSVNTKMWVPDGLMEIDVKESKTDINFVGDLEMYFDRIAIASGVPKGYLVQEWGGFGNSAVSLIEQFKPFARHVYTIQAAFLEALGELIRLHFAISKEYDYNIPFTLSMRFPAEEESDEKRSAKSSSLDLSTAVMDTISTAMGVEDGEPLPSEVVKDILAKYSFLNPTDIVKWTDKIDYEALIRKASKPDEDEEDEDEDDFDASSDDFLGLGGDDGDLDMDSDVEEVEEATMRRIGRLREGKKKTRLLELSNLRAKKRLQEARFVELKSRYTETKEDMYIGFLKKNRITEFTRNKRHVMLMDGSVHYSAETYFEVLNAFAKSENPFETRTTLKEAYTSLKEDILTDNKV